MIVTLPILWEQALPNSKVCSDRVMEQLHLKPDQELVIQIIITEYDAGINTVLMQKIATIT
jgi:hypothetical protein